MGLHRFGSDNPNWRGGFRSRPDGYVYTYVGYDHPHHSRGYVMDHRLAMESKLGRFLSDEEVVHHIDGNKVNNSIENLLLTTPSDHMRLHSVGRVMSESSKRKLSLSKMGHSVSLETRRKISETKKSDPRTSITARRNGRTTSKLDIDSVAEIRCLLKAGCSHRVVAEKFGVSRTAITHIATGKTWRDDDKLVM